MLLMADYAMLLAGCHGDIFALLISNALLRHATPRHAAPSFAPFISCFAAAALLRRLRCFRHTRYCCHAAMLAAAADTLPYAIAILMMRRCHERCTLMPPLLPLRFAITLFAPFCRCCYFRR